MQKLARIIEHEDIRSNPAIPQIVFYQSGIGSEHLHMHMEVIQGMTGATLGSKVQEAYGFIAHNYLPGDEIFLFGFSRGAYTARMVATFIGTIGVLDRRDMDHFAGIFVHYQKRGNTKDPAQIAKYDAELTGTHWEKAISRGKLRAHTGSFSVKCMGVFDTVGSLGLPEELKFSKTISTVFGFHNKHFGEHIEKGYQAIALNENRSDFDCALFEQTDAGRRKGQILKQCWFTGSHTDIGGGYHHHDLADLTLTWMAANICDMISLDLDYLEEIPEPVAPWGQQKPHDPRTGIFFLSHGMHRQLPKTTDNITHETIHSSVLEQIDMQDPTLKKAVTKHPNLVEKLLPLEEDMKSKWRFDKENLGARKHHHSVFSFAKHLGEEIIHKVTTTEVMKEESGAPVYTTNSVAEGLRHMHWPGGHHSSQ